MIVKILLGLSLLEMNICSFSKLNITCIKNSDCPNKSDICQYKKCWANKERSSDYMYNMYDHHVPEHRHHHHTHHANTTDLENRLPKKKNLDIGITDSKHSTTNAISTTNVVISENKLDDDKSKESFEYDEMNPNLLDPSVINPNLDIPESTLKQMQNRGLDDTLNTRNSKQNSETTKAFSSIPIFLHTNLAKFTGLNDTVIKEHQDLMSKLSHSGADICMYIYVRIE